MRALVLSLLLLSGLVSSCQLFVDSYEIAAADADAAESTVGDGGSSDSAAR